MSVAAGCGGGSLDASTTPLTDGSRVSPQRYLADSVAAVASVNRFSAILQDLAPTARAPALRAAAPRLGDALAETRAIAQRVAAQRLDDQRLEAQREEAAAALADVTEAMGAVWDAARDGDPAAASEAAGAYARSVGAIRSLPAAS